MDNHEVTDKLSWYNKGETAYLMSVATLASAILQTEVSDNQASSREVEIALMKADKALEKLITGELDHEI